MGDLFLGVLSGTSLDAIDIGLFSFTNSTTTLHHTFNYPIPSAIKDSCLALTETAVCNIEQLGTLDNQLGHLFATAIIAFLKEFKIDTITITAIGCHGQTIQHQPNITNPFTIQLGDPNIIAAKTGILTVADFRRKDLAVGGQGAPLAPAFHAAVFRSNQVDRVIVNIGGISNISILYNHPNKPVIGYDTGPGNCLLDLWTQQHFNIPYDQHGNLAKQGKVITPLLENFLTDPYFHQPYPKSTGREYFSLSWLNKQLAKFPNIIETKDILATLVQLTTTTISNAILSTAPAAEIYICGGGAYNQTLLTILQQQLQQKIYSTIQLGISPEWVEAGLFAWLAQQRLLELPGNLPSVTGATKSVVLGGVYK